MTSRTRSSKSNSSPGYRFHPTDEELVNHYLRSKMLGYDNGDSVITEVNVCKIEPWDLPKYSKIESDDQVWFFFCARDYKYRNSTRANRTTKAGYWKVTGKDRKIRIESTHEEIAIKKTLVFYEGRVPNGVRTKWVMHEYNPTFNFPNQRDFVLCKLKSNEDDMPTYEEGEVSDHHMASDFENQNFMVNNENIPSYNEMAATNFMYNAPEEASQLQTYLDSFNGYDETNYNLNSALDQPHMHYGQSSSYYPYGNY